MNQKTPFLFFGVEGENNHVRTAKSQESALPLTTNQGEKTSVVVVSVIILLALLLLCLGFLRLCYRTVSISGVTLQ